jgi:precorrin-4 methylase
MPNLGPALESLTDVRGTSITDEISYIVDIASSLITQEILKFLKRTTDMVSEKKTNLEI